MQLPQITYTSVEDEESGALRRAAAAAQGLSQVAQQGLTELGQEMVRKQTYDAHLKLSQDLDNLTGELRTKRTFSLDELKARLGDEEFEKLPEEIRNRPMVPALDANGQPLRDPRDPQLTVMRSGDVPTFQVADVLYRKATEKLLGDASQQITVGSGWQAGFQRAAMADIIGRGSRLNDLMLEQAHQYHADEASKAALRYATAGDFAMANQVVEGSGVVLGPDGQIKLRQHIAAMQQVRPVYDALLHFRTDPTSTIAKQELEAASRHLADQSAISLVDPQHAAQLARQVQAALKQADEAGNKRAAAALAFQIVDDSKDAAGRVNADAAYKALDARFRGDLVERPELWAETRSLIRQALADQTEARKQSLTDVAGEAMGQFMAIGPDGKPRMAFSNVTPQVRAGLQAMGEDGQKVLEQLVKWDQANELHERQRRNLPTLAESNKALAIERALAVSPGTFRSMKPGEFMQILSGNGLQYGSAGDAIPAGAVSSKDIPRLSELFAKNSAAVKPSRLVSPETVAFQEAQEAFPDLKTWAQRKTPERAIAVQTEEVRKAMRLLTDRLSTYIDAEVNRTGKEPPEAEVRKEARRLLQTVEVKKPFWWFFTSTETMPRAQAEATGERYELPTGTPAAPPQPPAAPPVAGAVHITDGEQHGWLPPGQKMPEGWKAWIPPSAPAGPVRKPPVPGAIHVTDGKRGAWLPPGQEMPEGWKAD